MARLWETDSFIDDNTLTVNVTRLRKKLEEAGLKDFITTKKGIGYGGMMIKDKNWFMVLLSYFRRQLGGFILFFVFAMLFGVVFPCIICPWTRCCTPCCFA